MLGGGSTLARVYEECEFWAGISNMRELWEPTGDARTGLLAIGKNGNYPKKGGGMVSDHIPVQH